MARADWTTQLRPRVSDASHHQPLRQNLRRGTLAAASILAANCQTENTIRMGAVCPSFTERHRLWGILTLSFRSEMLLLRTFTI